MSLTDPNRTDTQPDPIETAMDDTYASPEKEAGLNTDVDIDADKEVAGRAPGIVADRGGDETLIDRATDAKEEA